jgi:putative ABC transport system permease protein
MNEISSSLSSALPYLVAFLVSFAIGLSLWRWHRLLSKRWLIALTRGSLQLLLLSWILRPIFTESSFAWLSLVVFVMLTTASFAALERMPNTQGGNRYGNRSRRFLAVAAALVVACLPVALLAGHFGVGGSMNLGWGERVIPFLGLLLGNALSGISLGLLRWTSLFNERGEEIDALRSWGATSRELFWRYLRDPLDFALAPTLNALAVAGIVSIPGMMSGQLLAGVPPLEAALMQVLLFACLLISTASGTLLSIAFFPRPEALKEVSDFRPVSSLPIDEAVNRLLADGARISLSGPSGEGKSTYLRALSRMAPLDLRLCAQKPWFPSGPLADAIACFSRSITAQQAREWRDRKWIHETLRRLLHPSSSHRILDEEISLAKLSGGEAQVVQLVLSVASPARALLLDEPTAAMDPELRERVETFLLELPLPWILVTHDRLQAARLSNDVVPFSRVNPSADFLRPPA